jgi:ketosteroid isomerase-like protein
MFRTCVGALLCILAACEGKTQQMPTSSPAPSATTPGVIPGQTPAAGTGGFRIVSPVTQPALTPGVVELMELEGRFQQAVAQGGGKVFSEWFAEDAVVLNNGKPAILGRGAITAQAQWDPKSYQLNWSPQGALMGPSNDMGYTWGHYEGRAINPDGQPLVTSGRYFTVWRKAKIGGWKVVMDASANEPPESGTCCTLPKP